MKRLAYLLMVVFLFFCINTSAGIRLIALTAAGNPTITLEWNMVNYPGSTAYTLFKSIDGVIWETAAENPVLRNYTSSTILAYRDNFSGEQKLYYRVKVYDTNKNIVEISNTAIVNTTITTHSIENPSHSKRNTTAETLLTNNSNAWQIVPDPVHDMLNLVYRNTKIINGVINILITDASGKAVIRFRAASDNKEIHIPVSNLHAGIYFIKINVTNEEQLNDKFVKE